MDFVLGGFLFLILHNMGMGIFLVILKQRKN